MVIIDDCASDADAKALLPPLPQEDSVVLLRRFRPALSDAEAEALAALCANLPIALRIAGSLLSVYETMPATALIAELERDRIGGLVYEGDSVERIFAIGYARLSPELQAIWRALAVMPADFDRDAAALVGEFDPNAALSPLDELARRNLLEYDPATGRFRWHDLLRAFAGRQLDAGERAVALHRHAQHFIGVGWACDELYRSGRQVDGLQRFDAERLHLEQAFATLKATDDAKAIRALVYSVVHTSSLRFTPRQKISWWTAALNAARELGNRGSKGAWLGNLGNAYGDLGEVQTAIGYYRQALDIARELGDRSSEGKWLVGLGNAYGDLGEVQTAIGYYRQALDIARELGNRRSEVTWLGSLGRILFRLGRFEEAKTAINDAVAIYEELSLPVPQDLAQMQLLLEQPRGCLKASLVIGRVIGPVLAKLGLGKRVNQWARSWLNKNLSG